MICPRCGSEMQLSDPVCPRCGTRNAVYQPQQPVQAQYQQYPPQQYQQYPPQHQQPVYYAPPQPQPTNGMAIAGFVLSLIIPFLGIIFSFIGLSKSKELNGEGRGLAIAGIIISSIWILFFIFIIFLGVALS